MIFVTLPLQAQTSACLSALQENFASKVAQSTAQKFLALQGEITLNRLAWAHLKAQEESDKIESVEREIIELLSEKYSNTDPEFIKARELFESQPLSRTALSEVAPYLQDYFSHEFEKEDKLFVLNKSDVKLLGLLAKYEKKNAAGVFDHKMTKSGILNFTKLINSSYRNSNDKIEENIESLEDTITDLQGEVEKLFSQIDVPGICQEEGCPANFGEFFKSSEEVQEIVFRSLIDKNTSDAEIVSSLGYGDIWLKVKKDQVAKKVAAPKKAPTSQPKRFGTIKTVKSVKKDTPHVSDVLISDPANIIVKDRKGRSVANWKAMEKDFQTAMAESILADHKVFEYKSALYSRLTGKQLTADGALSFIPPKRRANYLEMLKKVKNPEVRSKMIIAMANGDQTFILKSKLYRFDGEELQYPGAYISLMMHQKTKSKYEPKRYEGMEKAYLVARANAMANNEPQFSYKGGLINSLTGRSIHSQTKNYVQDVKQDKQARKKYEYLDDLDVIRNYQRHQDGKCAHYGVIDKKNATFTIYQNDGKVILKKEVLVGARKSDQRTRWTDYKNRRTSQSTGAGVFTVRAGDPNDAHNKKDFNNNIISFFDESGDETVFAVHQVPVHLQERNKRFGTGDASDRRLSSGCANLKLSDFKDVKKYLGVACKVYILPEQEENKFVYQDKKIVLVNTEGSDPETDKFYNYNSHESTPKLIKMNITSSVANTSAARKFVKALEDEKPKLMKVLGITNDEYNELALIAFGIMGNESKFGNSKKLNLKEKNQDFVVFARYLKSWDNDEAKQTSRGYTQIKYLPKEILNKNYPEIKKETLMKPDHSAVATVVYLYESFREMRGIARENEKSARKVRITQETMIKYIKYFYQGGRSQITTEDLKNQATPDWNEYYQNLTKHMSYVEMVQTEK